MSASGNVYMKLFHMSPVPETDCPLGHTGLTIFTIRRMRCGDRAALGAQRGIITYLATLCNDDEANRLLPQDLLGNSHKCLWKTLREVRAPLPVNSRIIFVEALVVAPLRACSGRRKLYRFLAGHCLAEFLI